jgi:hypothetical protein
LPGLRKLAVLYGRLPLEAADFVALHLLPQLEVLRIGWWDGDIDKWSRVSECDGDDDTVYVPNIGDAKLERLVGGLPRLRSLALLLGSSISDDGLRLVGRACRQLEHLELRGLYNLYDVCHAAEAHSDLYWDDSLLFTNLVFLRLTGILTKDEQSKTDAPDERTTTEASFKETSIDEWGE